MILDLFPIRQTDRIRKNSDFVAKMTWPCMLANDGDSLHEFLHLFVL